MLVLQELVVFEVLDYESHPAIYSSRAIDGLGLIFQKDTQFTKELYKDDL